MKTHAIISIAAFGLGCSPDQVDLGGTAVGNPGEASMIMADNEGLTWTSATVSIHALFTDDCDSEPEMTYINDTFSLLGDDSMELPVGTYCELTLEVEDVLSLSGHLNDQPNTTFHLTVALPDNHLFIHSEQPFEINETATVLEFGEPNSLTASMLDLMEEEDTTIGHDSPVALFYGETLSLTSALWLDADENGDISALERQAGPLAAGDEWTSDEVDEAEASGEGCHASEDGEGWLLLLLTPFLLRRNPKNRLSGRSLNQ